MFPSDLTYPSQVIIDQNKHDKAMDHLLEAMDELYSYATRAGTLEGIDEGRKKLLKDMSVQTTQCAYFIRDQAQIKNFCEENLTLVVTILGIEIRISQGSERRAMRFRVHRSIAKRTVSPMHSKTFAAASLNEAYSSQSSA